MPVHGRFFGSLVRPGPQRLPPDKIFTRKAFGALTSSRVDVPDRVSGAISVRRREYYVARVYRRTTERAGKKIDCEGMRAFYSFHMQTIAREPKYSRNTADNPFMQRQEIKTIVDAANETADAIVGAKKWNTAEEASAMHDIIFWDILTKKFPNVSVADLLSLSK